MLIYNFNHMLNYTMKLKTFLLLRQNLRCTVICVIKAKYEINKIYVVKAKYKILVIANL